MQLWRIMNGKCPENTRVARLLRSRLEGSQSPNVLIQDLQTALERIASESPERSRLMLQMLRLMVSL